jgi:hypothetical protein
MDENEITQRLRDAGDPPIPGEVRASHLSQMHAATPTVERRKRFGRLAVAAAAFVGFAVGSTGFALAGALPDPAQQVAHDVLAVVQVNVEDPRHNRGQCVSEIARDKTLTGAAKAAAKAACKTITPGRSGQGSPPEGVGEGRAEGAGKAAGGPNTDDDPCTGRPPWAGKEGASFTADQKATFNQECGRGQDEAEEPEVEAETGTEAG